MDEPGRQIGLAATGNETGHEALATDSRRVGKEVQIRQLEEAGVDPDILNLIPRDSSEINKIQFMFAVLIIK